MGKFKVGDKVRALRGWGSSEEGSIYTIADCWYNNNHNRSYVRLKEHLSEAPHHSHTADMYELVETNPTLTPEEVFEHLRKGTKLQHFHGTHGWKDVTTPNELYYEDICNERFRVKPEPEIITLNGKRYQALED